MSELYDGNPSDGSGCFQQELEAAPTLRPYYESAASGFPTICGIGSCTLRLCLDPARDELFTAGICAQ